MTPEDIEKMSDEERSVRVKKLASEYYEFFRLGGAFSMKEFSRFDALQKAAALLAKGKVTEELVRLQTKCTMALIDRFMEAISKKNDPDAGKKSEEEVVVSGVLDKMEAGS